MSLLRIDDLVDGAFLSMPQVIAPLSPEAHALQWTILDLGEVIADARWDLDLPYVERQVAASPTGMRMAFEELEALGARVRQVIDGVFVGCRSAGAFPRRSDDDATVVAKADMLVAALDSTLWVVSAPEPVRTRVAQSFERVSDCDLAETALSTWGRDY